MSTVPLVESVLACLQGVRRDGNQWKALCPAHPDKNPSLSVREANGKILLRTDHAPPSLGSNQKPCCQRNKSRQ